MIIGIVSQQAAARSGITFVGAKALSRRTNIALPFDFTGLTDGTDSSPQIGDFCVVIASIGSASAPYPTLTSIPDGLSQIAQWMGNDNTDCLSTMYAGFFEAGSAATTWDLTGASSSHQFDVLYVFRGCDGFDVTPQTAQGTNSLIPDPPSITPVTPGSWIMIYGAGSTNTAGSYKNPSGYSFIKALNASGTTYGVNGLAGVKTDWVSGALDPPAFTLATGVDNTSRAWCAASIALKPA